MTNPVLQFQDLTKSFKTKTVLKGINLAVGRGRVVGVLGKNGAGKTTLIKCAMGLLQPTSGTSKVFGEDSWSLSGETKARIGYVPQEIDLYLYMRVRHMIAYIAAFYPGWNHQLVSTLVSKWELNPEDKIARLSLGQKQKLALILAMGHQPDLLVLDEPAASLDPQARRAFLSTIIDISSDNNRTVVLSTHLTSDLERVASDILMLKSGMVSYSGPVDALKDSVKALKLTSRSRLPRTLDFPGVLRCETDANEALLTVRGASPEMIRDLEAVYDADIEVRDLNLEDIFVEVHRD
jgi:ABC-2 type transport system ATP-binding protein